MNDSFFPAKQTGNKSNVIRYKWRIFIDGGHSIQTIKNDFTKTISNQIIEGVTNKTATMFKDNVFVNQAGQLFLSLIHI